MKKKCWLAMLSSCIALSMSAQINLSGRVVDASTGRGIEGASVRIQHTTAGCATSPDGEFTISNLKDGSYTLVASCLNYSAVTIPIDGSCSDMTISLEPTSYALNPVVVTGTGTYHRLKDSPSPVEVISGKAIRDADPSSFLNALTRLVTSASISTQNSTMYFNGLPDKYVLILVDGKKMAGDNSGSIDYDRIDLDAIKRIEVLSGASSALYGSDAIAGVINIITEGAKSPFSVSSNTRISSHQRVSEGVTAEAKGGKLSSVTHYNYRHTGGWQLSPFEINSKGEKVETKKQAVYKGYSHNATQNLNYDVTDRLRVGIEGTIFISDNSRFDSYDYDNRHQTYTIGGSARYLLPMKASYIDASVNTTNFRSWYDYNKDTQTHKKGDEVLAKNQTYTEAKLSGVFRLHESNTLFAGANYVYESLKPTEPSQMLNDEIQHVYTLAAYAQDEFKLWNSLSLVGGLRYVYNEKFKGVITPKANVMYRLGDFNIRAGYAAGFHSPTLQQMYVISDNRGRITIGNPDLKAEKSNYYNINLEYINRWITVTASVFQNDLRDKIETKIVDLTQEDKDNGIVRKAEYHNVGKARVRGINAGINVRPLTGVALGVSYNYNHARNITDDTWLERSIRHSGNFFGNWNHTWDNYTLNVNINGRYQGTRWSESYGDSPAFQTWDITTRHTFTLHSVILEPSLGVENIFNYRDDRPYNSNYATLTPGCSVVASLVIRFRQ